MHCPCDSIRCSRKQAFKVSAFKTAAHACRSTLCRAHHIWALSTIPPTRPSQAASHTRYPSSAAVHWSVNSSHSPWKFWDEVNLVDMSIPNRAEPSAWDGCLLNLVETPTILFLLDKWARYFGEQILYFTSTFIFIFIFIFILFFFRLTTVCKWYGAKTHFKWYFILM